MQRHVFEFKMRRVSEEREGETSGRRMSEWESPQSCRQGQAAVLLHIQFAGEKAVWRVCARRDDEHGSDRTRLAGSDTVSERGTQAGNGDASMPERSEKVWSGGSTRELTCREGSQQLAVLVRRARHPRTDF